MITLETLLLSVALADEPNEDMYSQHPSFYLDKYTHGKEEVRSLAENLVSDEDSNYEKITKVYSYFLKNTNYLNDPPNMEVVKTPKETLDDGGGDCEDLTLLLIALLENVNVQTYFIEGRTHVALMAGPVDLKNVLRPTIYYSFPENGEKYIYLDGTLDDKDYPGAPVTSYIERGLVVDSDTYEFFGRIGDREFKVRDYQQKEFVWLTEEKYYVKKEKIGGN